MGSDWLAAWLMERGVFDYLSSYGRMGGDWWCGGVEGVAMRDLLGTSDVGEM